jgi:hypothetical protein
LPKTDEVGCFHAGSSQSEGADFVISRETAHEWKDEGKGYFCCHGQSFQLVSALPAPANHKPFPPARVPSKLIAPGIPNYPIPAVVDHRLRWQLSFMAMPNA